MANYKNKAVFVDYKVKQRLLTYSWRRKRDLNPWRTYALNGFQDRRIQPLCHSSGCTLLLDGFLQLLAGGELGNLAGRNFHFLLGAGIAALAGSTLNNLEGTKTGQGHRLASNQRFAQDFNGGAQGLLGNTLALKTGFLGNLINQFCFCHSYKLRGYLLVLSRSGNAASIYSKLIGKRVA